MSRRVPPPWSDAIGHALAYVYFEDERGAERRPSCSPRRDRIAGNTEKLPKLSEARHDGQAPLTRRPPRSLRSAWH